jgi:hypothetical protein
MRHPCGWSAQFRWVIGLAAGFLTFVPYVGSLTGLVLAVAMASCSSGPTRPDDCVLGIFLIGQFRRAMAGPEPGRPQRGLASGADPGDVRPGYLFGPSD